MGNKDSKEQNTKTVGDQTITIVENLEQNSSAHEQHTWKLNLILVLLVIQTTVTIIKIAIKTAKRAMAKAAEKAVILHKV